MPIRHGNNARSQLTALPSVQPYMLIKEEDTHTIASEPEPEPSESALENTIEWSDSLFAHARELIKHRELLWLVTQREIKIRYKQSSLGVLWAVLQPLSLMLVLTVFYSYLVR